MIFAYPCPILSWEILFVIKYGSVTRYNRRELTGISVKLNKNTTTLLKFLILHSEVNRLFLEHWSQLNNFDSRKESKFFNMW